MARPSNEFILAWNSLLGSGNGSGWRTIPITPAGPCQLCAGRRFPGNEEALLAGFSSVTVPRAENLPEGVGFRVERVDPHHDGMTWLALTRNASGSADLFLSMVCDVAGALDADADSDQPHLLRTLLGRVRAWQEFMRKGVTALGPEAEIGLFGELALLHSLIDTGLPAARAIESWVGPFDGVQDFELGAGALEVKTTLSHAGFPARIGSLEQLDDSVRQPLFVVAIRLRQTADGQNLPGIVGTLQAEIKGSPEAERLLADRLLAAGYFDAHADHYPRRFVVVNVRVLEVADGFPRLTYGRVPTGILKAAYEVDLDKVTGDDAGMDGALRKLGVL
ncbi:MAG: PD-(D/E)XK motif protein [Burkholderiales bacterium]|nr:PD-(D/E)XK motif protein [Burkholderiales bacterium]